MIRQRWPFRALLILLVAAPGAPVWAAGDWPVPRGPSHEPAPYRFDRTLLQRIPREFLDDAVACVLYAGNTYLVEADGAIEATTHEVTHLNSRKGIDKIGEYRNIVYDPSFQKFTLNEARIHKADGQMLAVEPRHVQLRDVSTDYQVYDHEKQLIISFPTLEVGDTIEVKWTVRGKHPEHGGQFFTRYSFGDVTSPVVLDLFSVRLPKNKPFHFAPIRPSAGRQAGPADEGGGKFEPVRTEAGDFHTYTWKSHNCPRMPSDDNLPSKETLFRSVACSTFDSWAEVGQWKKRLRADCWECTSTVQKVVQDVTRGLTKPADKARALTYWLRHNIRYVSTGEKHDFTPHPPAWVLANRYGDCKDTSQLLAVMLREAGIAIELATLGALDDGQVLEAVPSPWGTHAILLASIDGQEHWIDTTASLAGWDFLPRDDRDRLCYLVDPQGRLRLKRTPSLSADGNRTEQTTHVWVGADGSSRCERVMTSYGSAALGQRDNFLEVPSGERRRQVTADLQDANSRARLLHLRIDEARLRDHDQPVMVRMVFEIPHHFSGSPEREGSVADSRVWNKLLGYNLDYERQVGLNLHQPFESRHRYVLHLPPGYELESLPRQKSLRTPWVQFSRKVKVVKEGEIEIEFHTRLDKGVLEPADFEDFHQFHEEVSNAYRAWLTLKPAHDLADVPQLEAALHWTPADSASAALLARLYLKNDKTVEARRVLLRARSFRPDDADLWELTVQTAGTPKEEEEAQRELVRRFPDDASHAIKLGAILVSQGQQMEARAVLEPLTSKGTPAHRAEAHFQLARSHYRRDQLEPALKHWEAAADADPDTVNTVRAYHLKGRIYEELGRPADAEKVYQLALAVNEQSELVLDSLIRLELAANNRSRALEYLRRYAVAVGEEESGLLLAADYYLRLECNEEALELIARIGEEKRYPAKAQRILGLGNLARGDMTRAAEHLARAKPDAAVLDGLLNAYLVLGRLTDAGARLEQADTIARPTVALRQTCERVRRLLARRAKLGEEAPAPSGKEKAWSAALDAVVCAEDARAEGRPPAQVKELLARAFAGGLEPGPAFALRGRLAVENGKLIQALADAEQAIVRSPREAGGYYIRGWVRLERGTAGALGDLETAARKSDRQDADILHTLAEALFRAGRVEEALATQRGAVKLKPKDREMAEQLATFERAASSSGRPGM